jgi:hypothetical protein
VVGVGIYMVEQLSASILVLQLCRLFGERLLEFCGVNAKCYGEHKALTNE